VVVAGEKAGILEITTMERQAPAHQTNQTGHLELLFLEQWPEEIISDDGKRFSW
jgi:hypothetical protein